ncbi:MAG: class B sortase [Clostridiales bacterium]|nr:class B sortase [Clostridiales bacterium]
MKNDKSPLIQWALQMLLFIVLFGGCGYFAYNQTYESGQIVKTVQGPYLGYEQNRDAESLLPDQILPEDIPLTPENPSVKEPAWPEDNAVLWPEGSPSPEPPAMPPEGSPSPEPAAMPPALPTEGSLTLEHSQPVIQPYFQEMREKYQNDDIVGYINIEGTSIDYLVTQYTNNDYYVDKDIYNEDSVSGWVFMDYENDVSKPDKNVVVYGHNMRENIMFHSLRYYQSKDYFEQHRYITLNTLYENTTWEVFAFYRTDIYFPYIQVIFPSLSDFSSLLAQMKVKSMYDTGVTVNPDDRILTLSTCTNETADTRFVVNAKLIQSERP